VDEVDAVLSGPRGRRFCAEIACGDPDVGAALLRAAHSPGDEAARRRLLDALASSSAARSDVTEDRLLACLADAVAHARYWQEPDEEDVLLADPDVVRALRPTAAAAAASPTWRWWSSPLDVDNQAHVHWTGRYPTEPPRLTGAADDLQTWRRETVEDERRAHGRPADPAAHHSGSWWSTPALQGLVTTSRALPGLGAAQLLLVEDDLGWSQARVQPLRPVHPPRVYEVTGPATWVELVKRYPLEVTFSRRHDWWRTARHSGRWFIPDWLAVAVDHDAVHLTVAAYLATPGRALSVEGGATLVAGWDPDSTYWLSDVLTAGGEPLTWQRRDDDGTQRWRPGGAVANEG
jgi:hypothetical protein